MSNIQSQIKALLRKQAHLDLLKRVESLLATLQENPEHEGLVTEVRTEIQVFLDSRVQAIETGTATKEAAAPVVTNFTPEEVQTVKMLVARAAQKLAPKTEEPPPLPINRGPSVPGVALSIADKQAKAKFAMENRHLEKARIVLSTKDGPVRGKIVGFDAPQVIIETDTGYRVPASLDVITME